jgi:glutaredoxin-like protein NrdH
MITIYSKDDCPQCEQAKKMLTQYQIEFEVKNILEDAVAMDFVITQGHKSVPQLYVNAKLLAGFQLLQQLTPSLIRQKVEELS